MLPSDNESNKMCSRPYSGALIFFQSLQKVPYADKCLINKIKKRFGCNLNPSRGPFHFWISRLIIFSGQIFLPPPFSLSFVLEPFDGFLPRPGQNQITVSFIKGSATLTVMTPVCLKHKIKSTVDVMSLFPSKVHTLLENRNRSCGLKKVAKMF